MVIFTVVINATYNFRERERKLAELKLLKTDYKPGVWNVNSVLMGGLGNEPEVNGKCLYYSLKHESAVDRYVYRSILTFTHTVTHEEQAFGSHLTARYWCRSLSVTFTHIACLVTGRGFYVCYKIHGSSK